MFALVPVMCIIMMMILFPFSLCVRSFSFLYLFLCSFFCVREPFSPSLSRSLALAVFYSKIYKWVFSFQFSLSMQLYLLEFFIQAQVGAQNFPKCACACKCVISRHIYGRKNVACPHMSWWNLRRSAFALARWLHLCGALLCSGCFVRGFRMVVVRFG